MSDTKRKPYLLGLGGIILFVAPITYGLMAVSSSLENIDSTLVASHLEELKRRISMISGLGDDINNLTYAIARLDFRNIEALLQAINSSMGVTMVSPDYSGQIP